MKPITGSLLQCLRVVDAHNRECKAPQTLRWLATALEVQQRTAGDYLKRLEARGLLVRGSSFNPRPTLTAAGLAALEGA